jgi:YD repeat-containing protein
MRFLVVIIVLIFFGDRVVAQSTSVINLPQVIPPPPDAAALGKYGDVPVTLNTGTAAISVPIYDIKTPRLSLPISLNYSCSGIKVNDFASWVGLEWSLDAGGMITRTIKNLDDFRGNGWYNSNVPKQNDITVNSGTFLANCIYKSQDTEPDIFFFNFCSNSGKFVFGDDKSPIIINYQQPIKISYDNPSSSFTILDGQGNRYYFGAQETNSQSGDYHGSYGSFYTSSWYLSKIVSFDRSDSITFTYFADNLLEQDFWSYNEVIGPYASPNPDGTGMTEEGDGHDNCCGTITGEPYSKSYPLRLSEIDFSNGKVKFFSSATRQDGDVVKLDSIVTYSYNYSSGQFAPLKTFHLNYGYYFTNLPYQPSTNPSAFRLRLDSMNIAGNDGSSGGSYHFAYDGSMLPWQNSNAQDMFGYFNGQLANASLVPTQTLEFASEQYTVGAGDRSVNVDSLQAGILKQIGYPTGGYTKFAYEPNSYYAENTATVPESYDARATGTMVQTVTQTFTSSVTVQAQVAVTISPYNYSDVHTAPGVSMVDLTAGQSPYTAGTTNAATGLNQTTVVPIFAGHTYQLTAAAYDDSHVFADIGITWQQVDTSIESVPGGGVRMKQAADYDINGSFLKSRSYVYGVNECGYGMLAAPVQLFNTNFYPSIYAYGDSYVQCLAASLLEERLIFTGSSRYDVFNMAGAPISYPQVTEYRQDSLGNDIGKTVYDYTTYSNSVFPATQNYVDGYAIVNSGWQGGQLYLQEDYAKKAGNYWPVKRVYNFYTDSLPRQGRGLKVGLAAVFQGTPALDSTTIAQGCFTSIYFYDYPIYAGTVLLAGKNTYDYDQNDTTKAVVTRENYYYDDLEHLQPTRTIKLLSDGTTLTTVNRYPGEIDSLSNLTAGETAAIDSLESRHYVTALVQTQTFRNLQPVNLVRTDFAVWNANLIAPDSIEEQISGFPIEMRLQYNNYDNNGNVAEARKRTDVQHSYIWDYQGAYPIAECLNADVSTVAYTSFEADGNGSWVIPSGSRDYTSAITGGGSYNLNNGSVSRGGLTSSVNYVVSYWSRTGGSYTVSGSTAVLQGKTINGWTYFEHQVSGVGAVTVSGGGNIDELRLYPTGAQMTTRTYWPLVGLSSECDVANRITYYEYDGLGRLKDVKDQDGNVIKTYQYHYYGQ